MSERTETFHRNFKTVREELSQTEKLRAAAREQNLLNRCFAFLRSRAIEVDGLLHFEREDFGNGFNDRLDGPWFGPLGQRHAALHAFCLFVAETEFFLKQTREIGRA